MKKVVLPTDFSDNAYNAIRYAVQLFKDVDTTFYLLHTYTPPVYQARYLLQSPAQFGLVDVYRNNSLTQLEELRKQLEQEFKNPKHRFILHSAFNTLVEEVIGTTESEKADLVIMGTQGATGAKEILFGTNTIHVIKKATCPVIVVPSGFDYEIPKEILFPTDYEVDYQKEQLRQLMDISKNHDSNLDIIHVSTGYDLGENQVKNKQKLNYILAQTAHLFHDLPDQEVIDAINSFQLKKRMNLLVMIRNKHTFFERLFVDPVIKKIGFHVNIPFMVIPHHQEN